LHDAAGGLQVVQDRLHPDEALHPHDLFGQERSVVPKLDVALPRDVPQALVEGHGYRLAAIRASRLPIAGANLKPWPLQADPITMRPRRSRMKRSSGVVGYMQVSAPTGSGSASGYVRATHSATRSTSAGSGPPSSSGPTWAPAWCAPAFSPWTGSCSEYSACPRVTGSSCTTDGNGAPSRRKYATVSRVVCTGRSGKNCVTHGPAVSATTSASTSSRE